MSNEIELPSPCPICGKRHRRGSNPYKAHLQAYLEKAREGYIQHEMFLHQGTNSRVITGEVTAVVHGDDVQEVPDIDPVDAIPGDIIEELENETDEWVTAIREIHDENVEDAVKDAMKPPSGARHLTVKPGNDIKPEKRRGIFSRVFRRKRVSE